MVMGSGQVDGLRMVNEGVFGRMSENTTGGPTSNHTPKGKFAPGNKAAVGAKREKLQSRQKELHSALDESWPVERIVAWINKMAEVAEVYADKYQSPKMHIQVADFVVSNRYGTPIRRIVMGDGDSADDWLRAALGGDEQTAE